MERSEVFGYVRVSTAKQVIKGYGLDVQIAEIKKYCAAHDLELVRIFKDKGVSGATLDRPGLTEMLSSFNGVRRVVVLNTSRLWRDDATVKIFIKHTFKQAKADILSIEQPTYSINATEPSDFLTNGILEILDQYDRMCINMKLAKGRRAKAQKGNKACGVAPIGYRWNERAEIAVDEDYAEIVKDIYNQYLKLKSIEKVQAYLERQGILTPRGKAFSKQAIADILANPFYKGFVTHGDVYVTGNHTRLISPNLFGRVQTQLVLNRKV